MAVRVAAQTTPASAVARPAPAVARPAPEIPAEGAAASRQGAWHLGAFFVAFLAVALFYVWTRTEVVKATYELGGLQKRIEAERAYDQKLRLEILTLKAPDRLAAVAVQRLEMQPPGEGQVVVVE